MKDWMIQSVVTDYGSEIIFNDFSEAEIHEIVTERNFLASLVKRTWGRGGGGVRLPVTGTIPNDHRAEAAFKKYLERKKEEALVQKISEAV